MKTTQEDALDAILDDPLSTASVMRSQARQLRERAHERAIAKILPEWPQDKVHNPAQNDTYMALTVGKHGRAVLTQSCDWHEQKPIQWGYTDPRQWLGPPPPGWRPSVGDPVRLLGRAESNPVYGLPGVVLALDPLTVQLYLRYWQVLVSVPSYKHLCPIV